MRINECKRLSQRHNAKLTNFSVFPRNLETSTKHLQNQNVSESDSRISFRVYIEAVAFD